MKSDCHDKSDENFCWQINLDEHSYLFQSDAPEDPSGQNTLEVGVWFEIMDIVEVNEPEVSIIYQNNSILIGQETHFSFADVLFPEIQCLVKVGRCKTSIPELR